MKRLNTNQLAPLLRLCLLGCFLCLSQVWSHGLAQSTAPDEFARNHLQLIAKNPDGLTFTLKLKDPGIRFHVGEIIRLELTFASSLPETYVYDNASYDRSGRLQIDSFILDRADGIADPLDDYYHKSLGGFMGGGLRGIGALSTKPEIANYDLNEWLRFDKPGKYRLYVVSHRLTKGKPYHQGNTPLEPASNVIQFEILPADREWEQKTFSEAVKVLDSAPKVTSQIGENGYRSACRVLRFMGTEAAVKEMVKRFRGQEAQCDFEYYLGLLGAPERSFVIEQMQAALDAPDQPVPGSLLSALTFLSYVVQNPAAWQQFSNDDAGRIASRLQWDERKRHYDLIRQSYLERLALTLPQKTGAAAAISTETLISFGANDKSKDGDGRRQQLAVSLAKVFTELPLETQRNLLEYRWKQISDAAMLPVLRQLRRQSRRWLRGMSRPRHCRVFGSLLRIKSELSAARFRIL